MTREEHIMILKFHLLTEGVSIDQKKNKWIAVDENGSVWGFRFKPKINTDDNQWENTHEQIRKITECLVADEEIYDRFVGANNTLGEFWKDSLMKTKELFDE